jgi:hypothetical protein
MSMEGFSFNWYDMLQLTNMSFKKTLPKISEKVFRNKSLDSREMS